MVSGLYSQPDWQFETHSNNVTSISIDSQYVWAATRHGLFRIRKSDGQKTHFSQANSNIQNDFLTNVLSVPGDSVWVGYYYFGAGVTDTSGLSWLAYQQTNSGLTSNFVRTLVRAPSGAIYMGTFYGGVNIYHQGAWSHLNTTNSPLPVSNFSGGIVRIVFTTDTSDVDVWFGTRYHGVYHRAADSTWTYYDVFNSPIPHQIVSGLAVDHHGRLWIGTHEGLAILEDTTWQVYHQSDSPLPIGFVHDIAVGRDGLVWLATHQGLVCVPEESVDDFDTWKIYDTANSGLTSDIIERVKIDPETGDLWVGTYSRGLVRFDGTNWMSVPLIDTSVYLDNDIRALRFAADSSLLVCTETGGLMVQRDSQRIFWGQANGLLADQIKVADKDSKGDIWVAYSFDGMTQIRGDSLVHYTPANSPLSYPYNVINDLYIDPSDDIWLAINRGMWQFSPADSVWTFYEADTSGTVKDVTAIEPDSAGGFWYAGRYMPLMHRNMDGSIDVYNAPDHLMDSVMVTDLEVDPWGNVWIATFANGLVRYDTSGDWSVYDMANSAILSNSISSLQYTPDTTLWLGSFGAGLFAFRYDDVDHYGVYTGHLPQQNVGALAWDAAQDNLYIGMLQMGLGFHHLDIYHAPDDTTAIRKPFLPSLSMEIYPNPAGRELHVSLAGTPPAHSFLQLLDEAGHVLSVCPALRREQTIPIGRLPKSHYYIVLTGPFGKLYKPFAKR